jgi:hypothetical protein
MNAKGRNWIDPVRLLTFRDAYANAALCPDCQRDLEIARSSPASDFDRFRGKYLIHLGKGYQVMSLPGFIYVHFGESEGISDADLERERLAGQATKRKGGLYEPLVRVPEFEPENHLEALSNFSKESNQLLKQIAKGIFEQVISEAESNRKADSGAKPVEISDGLINAAGEYPDIQAKLRQLRKRVDPK